MELSVHCYLVNISYTNKHTPHPKDFVFKQYTGSVPNLNSVGFSCLTKTSWNTKNLSQTSVHLGQAFFTPPKQATPSTGVFILFKAFDAETCF